MNQNHRMDPTEIDSPSHNAEINNSDKLVQSSAETGENPLRETDPLRKENGLNDSLVNETNPPVGDVNPSGRGNCSDPSRGDEVGPVDDTDPSAEVSSDSSGADVNPSSIDADLIQGTNDPSAAGVEVTVTEADLSTASSKTVQDKTIEQKTEQNGRRAILLEDKTTEDTSENKDTFHKVVLTEHTGEVISIGGDVSSNHDAEILLKDRESDVTTAENKLNDVKSEVQRSIISEPERDESEQTTDILVNSEELSEENVTDLTDKEEAIEHEINLDSKVIENNSKVRNLEDAGDNNNASTNKENASTLESGRADPQEAQSERRNPQKEQSNTQNKFDNTKSETGGDRTGTPESVGASVDLTVTDGQLTTGDDNLKLPPSRYSERAISTTSYVYNDSNDFPTPDYDQFMRPTPSAAGSEKDKGGRRSSSKLNREGAKSVTFADNVLSKGENVEGNEEDIVASTEEVRGHGRLFSLLYLEIIKDSVRKVFIGQGEKLVAALP